MVLHHADRYCVAAGSLLIDGQKGLNIGFLMPTLREELAEAKANPLPDYLPGAKVHRPIWALACRMARVEALDGHGANFGFLLGSQHQFRGFGPALLEKYVCLGEDDDLSRASGRYADVTKSADLYIDSPDFVLPTTISDTPGVNDPFLARKRATLATLGKTDVCVIVLSANQAFSTIDLALMRVPMAMKAEQIILFVNRVDELENPDTQIPEIDAFIRGVLQSKGIKTRVPIVYGSAVWAELAMRGEQSSITRTALQRLMLLADARVVRATKAGAIDKQHLGRHRL